MEPLNTIDVDLEDGELSASSEDVYKPLPRPTAAPPNSTTVKGSNADEACSPLATCHQMQCALEDDESQSDASVSSSGESSDTCLKKSLPDRQESRQKKRQKRIKRTVMVRVKPISIDAQDKRARFKKYNIWTAALQEDTLAENMRDCDVTLKGNDRNVENYDFTLRYHVKGGNSLKRRLSNSNDDLSDGEFHTVAKRGRRETPDANNRQHRTIKRRLGERATRLRSQCSTPTSESDNVYEPRHIPDLDDPPANDPEKLAREMATKLNEGKEYLFIRAVEILGTELPIEIFKEAQRIEADGGMTIKNGVRRRTPGGVFLFLLKNHEKLSPENQKLIFNERLGDSWREERQLISRERKVEELKKRLSEQDAELPTLLSRKEHFLQGSELSLENHTTTLSNPPPSPVGQDTNFEYKPNEINEVITEVPPKQVFPCSTADLAPSSDNLVSYDDDFLDLTCANMDFI